MVISDSQLNLLNSYLGQGNIYSSSIIFFGNEFGLASKNIDKFLLLLNNVINEKEYYNVNNFFLINKPLDNVINSPFVRLIAKLLLSLYYNDDRWIKNINKQGEFAVNNFILNDLYRSQNSIINMRHLPRPDETKWIYDNINKTDYLKQYKFNKTTNLNNRLNNIISILKDTNALIISIGDKNNKLNLFKTYMGLIFDEIKLQNNKTIYLNYNKKILLCDYFDYRVLGLNSLQEIFNIINNNNLYEKNN